MLSLHRCKWFVTLHKWHVVELFMEWISIVRAAWVDDSSERVCEDRDGKLRVRLGISQFDGANQEPTNVAKAPVSCKGE
ncbi:hypothetical protein WJ23_00090 [Burkholderia lata]|nr:hypothetical protein WJ23_00090 [Burkholderia lata]